MAGKIFVALAARQPVAVCVDMLTGALYLYRYISKCTIYLFTYAGPLCRTAGPDDGSFWLTSSEKLLFLKN